MSGQKPRCRQSQTNARPSTASERRRSDNDLIAPIVDEKAALIQRSSVPSGCRVPFPFHRMTACCRGFPMADSQLIDLHRVRFPGTGEQASIRGLVVMSYCVVSVVQKMLLILPIRHSSNST